LSTKIIKILKKILDKNHRICKIEVINGRSGKLKRALIGMKKLITFENYSEKLNEQPMMMCYMDMCCRTGMGGLPM
jgi:hypothetical protein